MVASALVSVDTRSRHREMRRDESDRRVYEPRGGARELFFALEPEVLIEGPAGTGKSLGALKRLDRNAVKYPGSRQLIVRKTRTSLTQTALVTFEKFVIIPGGRVRFHTTQQAYLYPNGSKIVVGGLDKDSKVMSSEYDTIYIMEATEVTEGDWEALTTRLRNGVIPHQQIIADCNPGPPTHWLNQRCLKGKTRRILSRHVDNPALIDPATGARTPLGEAYLAKLDALTGVRRARLYEGHWVAAEGQVYEVWDDDKHLVEAVDLGAYRRRIGSVDWGWTKPGVLQVWGVDGDQRMAQLREVYRTRKPVVGWWVPQAQALTAEFGIEAWYCDPSEPAYIQDFVDAGLKALPATNDILPGVTAVNDRLAPQGDTRVRLVVVRDAVQDVDPDLEKAKQPTSTVTEIPSYVWPKNASGVITKDKPVDAYNHGCDAMRYAVMAIDGPQLPKWSDYDADNFAHFLLEAGVGD